MNQDPLDKLARALAKEHDGAFVAPDVTRARVMEQLRNERRKRRLRLFCFAPLLGVGVGSTAFAAAGTDLPAALAWVPALFAADETTQDVPTKALATSRSKRPPTEIAATASSSIPSAGPPPAVPTPAVPASPELAPAVPSSPGPAPAEPPPVPAARPLAVSSAAARSAPERTAPARSAQTDIGLAAYRRAHDAQFKAADFQTALAGYRRYLAEYPRGVLAAEANYNSALCQLRLGQTEAARRSLTPFARGTYGSYRQEEARALLEALGTP